MSIPLVHQAGFVAALVDPSSAVPAGIVSYRGDSDTKRFAVYRNNVHVGLVAVLAAKYPVCRQLVGEEFFTAMARVYVAENKPSSSVMIYYAADFSAFIGGFAGARSVPYLADMAALEQAWSVAYNAADKIPASLEEIVAIDHEALPDLALKPHPAVGLLRSDHPIGSIWAAHQTKGVPVQPGSEAVLVTRPAADVRVTVIPGADATFADALFQGSTIGDAAEYAMKRHPEFDFGRALVGLCSLGTFSKPTAT